MTARIHRGMNLGVAPNGDLSFDVEHAAIQLEPDATGIEITLVSRDMELLVPGAGSLPSFHASDQTHLELDLPEHRLTIVNDFARVEPAELTIRLVVSAGDEDQRRGPRSSPAHAEADGEELPAEPGILLEGRPTLVSEPVTRRPRPVPVWQGRWLSRPALAAALLIIGIGSVGVLLSLRLPPTSVTSAPVPPPAEPFVENPQPVAVLPGASQDDAEPVLFPEAAPASPDRELSSEVPVAAAEASPVEVPEPAPDGPAAAAEADAAVALADSPEQISDVPSVADEVGVDQVAAGEVVGADVGSEEIGIQEAADAEVGVDSVADQPEAGQVAEAVVAAEIATDLLEGQEAPVGVDQASIAVDEAPAAAEPAQVDGALADSEELLPGPETVDPEVLEQLAPLPAAAADSEALEPGDSLPGALGAAAVAVSPETSGPVADGLAEETGEALDSDEIFTGAGPSANEIPAGFAAEEPVVVPPVVAPPEASEFDLAQVLAEENQVQEAPAEPEFLPLSDLRAIRQPPISYPRRSLPGSGGTLTVEFLVTESGEVMDITTDGDVPDYFIRQALETVSRWRFRPVIRDGQPIPVRTGLRVTYDG
jgi:TonB family protein